MKSSSSRRSSFVATDDDFLDDDEEDQPKLSKAKKPAGKASAPKLVQTASSGGGGGSFLTAAEQRALEKKDDKKKAETPFAFLQDVRDVCLFLRLLFPIAQFYYRKMAEGQATQIMIPEPSTFLLKLGRSSHLSRSRCDFISVNCERPITSL